MNSSASYDMFAGVEGQLGALARNKKRQAPLLWQAGVVDALAISLLRCFFRTGKRPHFRHLPRGLASTAAMYNDPSLLAAPDLFYRPVPPPSPRSTLTKCLNHLPQGRRLHLAFKSLYQTYDPTYQQTYDTFKGNEQVHARVWVHDGPPRPTIICMHGWGGGTLWLEEQIFGAAALYRAGLNVVVTLLPFHGPRHPKGSYGLNLFPSSDLQRTYEGFGQAVADIRSLMQWLLGQGIADRIGYVGYSLGGYVGALLASLDNTLDFLVPMITPVSMADLLWTLELDTEGVREAGKEGLDLQAFRSAFALHCPLTYQLQIPKERVLLVAGRADHVVPPQQVVALWEHWGHPPLEWFSGGHYLHFGRSRYQKKIYELAAPPVSSPASARPWRLPWLAPSALTEGLPGRATSSR